MKKEILSQYIYREKTGNIASLKEYYSINFDSNEKRYEYIWKYFSLQESILLCNRNLFKELSNFYNKSAKKRKKLLRTLENYFIRFCTRPSSFFTFGYVGVGSFSHDRIESIKKYGSKSTEKIIDISTEWTFNFLQSILKNRDVLKELSVFSNPNLVEIGTKLLNQNLHFYQSDLQRIFLTDLNDVLSEIIETCKTPLKIRILVDSLLEKGFEMNAVYDYIWQLIDSEILLLECFEILAKDNKIHLLESFLHNIEFIPVKLQRNISQIKEKIGLYNTIQLGGGIQNLMDLYNIMDETCKVGTPLNVLYISHQVQKIDYSVKNEIEEFLSMLLAIKLKYKQDDSLEEYGRKFYNLYGSNNLVPLKELLSVKNLGAPSNYSNPILSTFAGESLKINKEIEHFQHDLVNIILSIPNCEEIKLESLIEQDVVIRDSFPTSEVVFSIYEADNQTKLRWHGNQYSDNFFSISGKYVPHFKDILDTPQMLETEKRYYNNLIIGIDEFHNNLVLNDIKRENRLDKMTLDFPFFKNIDISDIYIYLDNQNNFKAYSKKTKTDIHILKRNRISPNLLNNQTRFLYSIFCNKLSYYDFYKALSIDYLNYQNRVIYKDIIVYPRTWRMSKNTNFEQFIKQYSVPRLINLVEGDMELLINLDKIEDVEKVKQQLKLNRVILTEYLGNLNNSQEIIVFSKTTDVNTRSLEEKHILEKIHPISEEWFSFHLYCKEELVTLCIENILNKVLNLLDDNNIEHSINFVQYYYSEYHIRFRIKILRATDRTKVLVMLTNIFSSSINDGLMTRYEMLPYRMDFSSLGGFDYVRKIEEILTLDSMYVISHYSTLRTFPIQQYIIILLNIFESFELDNLDLINHFEDIGLTKNYSLYRDVKEGILKTMDLNIFPSSEELLKKFKYIASISNRINSKRKLDTSERIEIAKNYIHLFLNKIFFNKIYEEKIYQLFYLYLIDKEFTKKVKI